MRYMKIAGFLIATIALMFSISCGDGTGSNSNNPSPPKPPADSPKPPAETFAVFLIEDVVPSAANIGDTVTINYSGDASPDIVWSGKTITGTPVGEGEITFRVPEDAVSGPLRLKKGDSTSNSIWYSVSETSVRTPKLEDVVEDELGNLVAVNQLLISLIDGKDTYAEAERLARLVDGEIVGQIPLMSAYQFLLKTKTLAELETVIETLEADASVENVIKNIMTIGEAVDWSRDLDLTNQRLNNRVEQGANHYVDHVHPTNSGKTSPIFTTVGVVESDVDFTQADFDGYAASGLSRSNNIGLYAKQGSVRTCKPVLLFFEKCTRTDHGTVVTGVIAAELGDGGMAGLLQAVSDSHGGFNVLVESDAWVHGQFDATSRMAKNNVQVINWSFGIHKKGAVTSTGRDVKNNLRSAKDFNSYRNAATKLIRQIEIHHPKTIIVTSAGNGDTDAGDYNLRAPSSITSNNLIVVGAHNNNATPTRDASYSNYGNRVDISASGTVRNYAGEPAQGTSFSTPLVTATIATILSIEPDLTPHEIRKMLRETALPIKNTVNLHGGSETVFTAPLTAAEVGTDETRLGQGALLNVEDAIQAALDKRDKRTVPESDLITIDLRDTDITRTVSFTLPEEGSIYDKVDILFLVDVTGSYSDDIAQFRSQANSLINAFMSGGRNVEIGLASFADFPISSYGASGDFAYKLNVGLTNDTESIIEAINALRIFNGADGPESQLEALYQAATGLGRVVPGRPSANIDPSNVGWRDGSLRIIFLATDASFHDSDKEPSYPGAGFREALAQLKSKQIRVYGLQSGSYIQDVQDIVDATGGLNFRMSSNSAEIVTSVGLALDAASKNIEVALRKNGDFLGLIKSITPESYRHAQPGDTLTFDVTFSRELLGTDKATHIFSMQLEVIAEGVAVIHVIPVTVNVR